MNTVHTMAFQRLANYERLIPDEFRVFLRSESDRQKFIKNLGLTIQQVRLPRLEGDSRNGNERTHPI